MEHALLAVAALSGLATIAGLLLHVVGIKYRAPAWHAHALKLSPRPLDQLQGVTGWVWATAPAAGVHEGLLHQRVSWARVNIIATKTRVEVDCRESPSLLSIGDEAPVSVRVGIVERPSHRREIREKSPLGSTDPDDLNSKAEINERAILPGDTLQVIGKLETEHGRPILRAHYADACIWRGSAQSLRSAVEAKRHWSKELAPQLVCYGGFACIIGLLLYSMVAGT